MSGDERTGRRDLLYSRWHRVGSIKRFLGIIKASQLEQIDIDSLESCPICHAPLALGEAKNSLHDPSTFNIRNTERLAAKAGLPAFVVCYTCCCGVSGQAHETKDGCDIKEFRVEQRVPSIEEMPSMKPEVYAYWLYAFRIEHYQTSECSPQTSQTTVAEEDS